MRALIHSTDKEPGIEAVKSQSASRENWAPPVKSIGVLFQQCSSGLLGAKRLKRLEVIKLLFKI
jgi:hypothetical protein